METTTEALVVESPGTGELAAYTPSGMSREDVELLKESVCKGANDSELKLFLNVCSRLRLDPFARQIYAVKRWDADVGREVMTWQVGIDGLRVQAERTGNYAPGRAATYTYSQKDGRVISATAYVRRWVRDGWVDVDDTAWFEEFCQYRKDGKPMRQWQDRPRVMLSKCAEARALRRAFPNDLAGLYIAEEMPSERDEAAPTADAREVIAEMRAALPAAEPRSPDFLAASKRLDGIFASAKTLEDLALAATAVGEALKLGQISTAEREHYGMVYKKAYQAIANGGAQAAK